MPPKRRDNSARTLATQRRNTRQTASASQQLGEPQTNVSSDVTNISPPVSQTNIEETIRKTLNSLLPSIMAQHNNAQHNNAPQNNPPYNNTPNNNALHDNAPHIHVEIPVAPNINLRPFNGNGDIVNS
jgi:hypothetical protein